MRRPSRMRGFTLVEAMVGVAILAILAAGAMPPLSGVIRAQRVRAVSADLAADLRLARSEAILRASTVSVVAPSGWAGGWSVRVDGGLYAGRVVQQREAPGAGVAVDGVPVLSFDRDGRLLDGAAVRLSVRDTVGGDAARCVSIDLSGLARTRIGRCA